MGIQELISAVQASDILAAKFSPYHPNMHQATDRAHVMPHEVAMIPLVLAERYIARGLRAVNESALAKLYRDQECYLLAKDLRGDVMVPIPGVRFSGSRRFGDYSIVRATPEIRNSFSDARTVSPLDVTELCAFEHVLLIKDVPVKAEGQGFYFIAEPDGPTEDLITRFFEALSVVRVGSSAFIQYLVRPRGWLASFEKNSGTCYPYIFRDYAERLDRSYRHHVDFNNGDMNDLRKYEIRLKTAHASVRVATRRLMQAYSRNSDEDTIIDLCIGLEALLGSGFGETVHRLCLRAAAILSANGWGDSRGVYRLINDVYSYRSRVVHGTPGPHKKDTIKLDQDEIIHSSRVAAAALSALLKVALSNAGFKPDEVDDKFVFAALDMRQVQTR